MKITEIQSNKKYWKQKSILNSRTRKKEVTGIAVYVLRVDLEKGVVLASLNGKPAEWFKKNSFCRWKTNDPTKPTSNY